MSRIALVLPWAVVAAAAWMGVAPARAQANLDAGKSAAQIFADTCNACHRSPREIKATSAAFLRDHYTTGPRAAAAMAAYLASIGSDTRAVQQRRPSESIEAGNLPIAAAPGNGAEAGAPQAAAAAPSRQSAGEEFEE